MASHHHHHRHYNHHHQMNAAATGNICCNSNSSSCSCCCCCCSCRRPSAQPTEPLLQAIVSQLLHQQQQQQQQQTGVCCRAQTLETHQHQNFHQKNLNFQHQQQENFVLSSLFSRIDALETSLQNFSLSSTSFSLRDMAARVIQTHFRAFLVRRSRTLRQLKELALIKSSFNSLKLSVSKKPHFDFHVVSQKAMDLLLKLDSIQGGDPMIRDGKRSIRKYLITFLEFVDGFAVKRYEISTKAEKNVRFDANSSKSRVLRTNGRELNRDQAEVMSKLNDRIEKLHGFSRVIKSEEDEDVELEGFHELLDDDKGEVNPRVSRNKNEVLVKRQVVGQPRMKKSVTFAENGNVYRFVGNGKSNGSSSSEDGTLTDESQMGIEGEEIKGLRKETVTVDDEEELYLKNGGSLQSSDGERNPRGSMRTEGRYEIDEDYEVEDGKFVFSAPVPVKMESRADLMKRKALKIVT